MKLNRNSSSLTTGALTVRSYEWNNPGNLTGTTVYPSQSAGGVEDVLVRSPGKKPDPVREKAYRRTYMSAVLFNGDLSWPVPSWWGPSYSYIVRFTGTFSLTSGTSGMYHRVSPEVGTNPGVNAFFDRYAIRTPDVNLDLRSQAEVKCLNKLRDQGKLTDLNFGLLWGERRETAEFLARVMDGTATLMKLAASRDFVGSARKLREDFGVRATAKLERARLRRIERELKRDLKRTPRAAEMMVRSGEDAILTYNLAYSPLVNDLKAAVNSLCGKDPETGFDVEAKASCSRTVNDSIEWYMDPATQTCKCWAKCAETHGYTVTLRARPRFTNLALLSRLGIVDLSLGWQLTRLSFLVDYELAVGPWLSALNALVEFEWVDGSYTQRYSLILSAEGRSSTVGHGRASGSGLVNHTQRRVYSGMPMPAPPMSSRIRNLSSRDAQDAATARALNVAALASRFIRDALRGAM